MSDSFIQRFIFEQLAIRGAIVRLGDAWQHLQVDRNYQPPVAQLLGETAAVTALIAGQLKQPGRLTLQLRGGGPIQLLVMDCNEQLQIRGMARSNPVVLPAPVPDLLGAHQGGQLMLSLDMADARRPYQSFVPMVGNSIGEIFEHYLEQSEQQPSRLFLTAAPKVAACLFLQKLPEAEVHDADAWQRITHLASTVKPQELLELDSETLLTRLFHEEMAAHGIRVLEPREVVYHCPRDWEKTRDMIRALGQEDAETIVREHGEIVLRDDICNHEYRFSAEDVAALFAADRQATRH
jgi:molecular chaperone Hsp33